MMTASCWITPASVASRRNLDLRGCPSTGVALHLYTATSRRVAAVIQHDIEPTSETPNGPSAACPACTPGRVSAADATKDVRLGVTAQPVCAGHSCDGCRTCARGTCCRRDLPDYRLPEFGSWSGPIFGRLGVLILGEVGAECHICGAAFRMLATHVWKAHGLWADEYRALFGLSARRGLVGRHTHDRLRAIAAQHLVPHHEAVLELLSRRTFDERSASARGRQLRLETRLDAKYQQALRGRAQRQSVRLRVEMQDPAQAEKVKQRLRGLGPSQATCAECGTPFLSPVQGASSRAVLLCGDACRADRKRRLRRERQANSRAELVGKLAVARAPPRREGSRIRTHSGGAAKRGEQCHRLASTVRARSCAALLRTRRPPARLRPRARSGDWTGPGASSNDNFMSPSEAFSVSSMWARRARCVSGCLSRRAATTRVARAVTSALEFCDSRLARATGSGKQPAARGGQPAAQLRALDRSAFDVLDELERELVWRYFALDTELPSTQTELADRFGLTSWQVEQPAQAGSRAAPRSFRARPTGRGRAPPVASAQNRHCTAPPRPSAATALRAVTPQSFEGLPELEQDLVRRYYGLGDDRPGRGGS